MNRGQFMLSQVSKVGKSPQNEESTFRILVATDNHVGFKEDDPIRCEDSFKGLEEVLKTAKEEKVDFLLLGGDLFHETHPSQKCMYKMINMLGDYVLGDGEIDFQMPNYPANFQDSNLNIELPIFIIHGNHDYPSDEYGNLSVLDLLHASKYLNHFGKFSNLNQITVNPIIFQKRDTTIALYGVGYMKDKYFHKMLEEGNIKFVPPADLGYENAISILVIHQSRYKGVRQGSSYKNCVHPEQFPKWIDLIIRGHEHEQFDEIEEMRSGPRVIQPGSTVPTSLIPSEATPRRAILFEINGQDANFQEIILIKSYRPILYENIEMASLFKKANIDIHENPPSDELAESLLKDKINVSIQEFANALDENFPQCQWMKDIKPQIRFKVEHTGIDVFNFQGLESQLADMVANPGQIFKFWKRFAVNNHAQDFKDNPKLEQNFLKTLREKDDFDTIGNDTMKDIKELYEARVNQNDRIKYLPCSVFMNTVESVGQRNRTQQIEDILQNLQAQIISNVTKTEQDKIIQINRQYKQQMNGLMAKISSNIEGRKRDSNQMGMQQQPLNKIVYQSQMTQQLGEMMHTMAAKIKQNVNQLYALDFVQNNKELNDDAMEQDADAEYQKLMAKNQKTSDLKRKAIIKGSEIVIENQQHEEDEDYQVQRNKLEDQRKKQYKDQGDKYANKNALDALKTMKAQPQMNQANRKQQKQKYTNQEEEEEEEEEDQDSGNIWNSGKKYKEDNQDDRNYAINSQIKRTNELQGNNNDKRDKQQNQQQKQLQQGYQKHDQVELKSALKRANYAEMFHKNVDSEEDEIDQEDEEQSNLSDCELKFEPNQPAYQIAHISEFKKQSVTSSKLNQTSNNNRDIQYNPQINNINNNQNRLKFPPGANNNTIQSTLMSSLIQNNITNPQNNKLNQNTNNPFNSSRLQPPSNNIIREQQQPQQQQQQQVSDRKSKVLIPLNKKKVDFTNNESIPRSPEQSLQQQHIKDHFKKKINITNSKNNS